MWRIWRVENSNKAHHIDSMGSNQRRSHLQKVIRIVVESGLLYTITAFISFTTFVTGSNGVYVITDAVSGVIRFLMKTVFIQVFLRKPKLSALHSILLSYEHLGF